MKKLFYFVAVATFALVSCQNDDDIINEVKSEPVTFKASIEDLATRGDINASNGLVWATGDKIGIYVNDTWNDKNQPFTLSSGAGTTTGEFTWDYTGDFSDKAAAAFYPWQGTGYGKNNVHDGTMYFNLPKTYYGYTSGQMLTPLIASLSGSTTDIQFKHAGAAVKVTINNLPAGAHSIGMTVDGKQIYGDYRINPANAGTDALVVSGSENVSQNEVWLNYENNSQSEWTFIFPVPELTKPKLSFQIYDINDILVWSTNLKAQSSDIGRADILVMPAKDITPYSQFTNDPKKDLKLDDIWAFCGSINGSAWQDDVTMYTDGTNWILSGKTFAVGDEFKIRKNGKWPGEDGGEAYPSSNSNWVFTEYNAGTKDIIFNSSTHEIKVENHVCPYPYE